MSYYCVIRDRKPKRIIEVGSGFSTFVASEAVAANGHGEIVCIEPYPRDFLRGLPHVVKLIETIPADRALYDGAAAATA